MDVIAFYPSILGELIIRSDGTALTGIFYPDQEHLPEKLLDLQKQENEAIRQTKRWLDIYFSRKDPGFLPPLRLEGTPFQKRVWRMLQGIPYGHRKSYKEIAQLLAMEMGIHRMSAQAVGGAVGKNPISIIVPCHRVVGSDGSLTGYAGGIERKKMLLELETIKP